MAVEKAGVELVAEDFNKYIKRLDIIDKKQREVFSFQSKDIDQSFNKAAKSASKFGKESKRTGIAVKGIGLAAAGAAGIGIAAISSLTSAVINLGTVAATAFIDIVKEGVVLNKQFELTERVFTNVFGDPNLGKATVDFLNQTADRFRINRKEAAKFAQTILPKSGGLDQFTELLRLTDIQADTTGQTIGELEFSIREALSGDFVSLKDRFDLGTEQISRIRDLTPSLGRAQALIKVITEEFTILGKTDISGTLGTNIKDLEAQFSNLQAVIGKPTFDILKAQTDDLLKSLDRNEEGIKRTAIALGEVTGNIVELVGTEIIEFIDSLDFAAIEEGINNANKFIETLRVLAKVIKVAFETGIIQTAFGIITGSTQQVISGFEKLRQADFGQALKDISDATVQASERQADYKKRVDETANSQSSFTSEAEDAINALLAQSDATEKNEKATNALSSALKQAESLALSFARSQEDATRKATREIIKLEERQKKDRSKFLDEQIKDLDDFDDSRRKEIAKAEDDITKERDRADRERLQAQRRLQRKLRQEQDRFDLSQLQSTRRFELQETRLRAEGDILALQQLREDKELQELEAQESFDLSQSQTKEDGKEQQKIQSDNLDGRLSRLKADLDDQRAELLASFDEQLIAFDQSQKDQRIALDLNLKEQETDRRLSQQRQLEDLGQSFANQEAITEEGATAIANELETVFGIDGTASAIMTGFTTQTESEFVGLFERLEEIVNQADLTPQSITPTTIGQGARNRSSGSGLPRFEHGTERVPGPIGQPQVAIVHGGEKIIPAQQTIAAPVIQSQNLNVEMSGGFNITGGEGAGQATVEAAVTEMTDTFILALKRVARRGSASG